jgi:hypothetical protein
MFPQPFTGELSLPQLGDKGGGIAIMVCGTWRIHRAKLEGFLLNGSYSFTSDKFAGSIATPAIDLHSAEPGPGWDEMPSPPAKIENAVVAVRHGANVQQTLIHTFGPLHLLTGEE